MEVAIEALAAERPLSTDDRVGIRPLSWTLNPVLAPFALSRVLLVALTLGVAAVRHHNPLALWAAWDGAWYTGIAAHGYHWGIHGKTALAFFPLFPLLIRLGMAAGLPALVSAILLSNAAFLGALFYLHRLAEDIYGQTVAGRVTWLVAFLPTAFFFFGPYSESVALLCTVAAVYYARKRATLLPGLLAAGATLARPTGVIIIPAMLALRARRRGRVVRNRFLIAAGHHVSLLVLAVVPTGLAMDCYLMYLGYQGLALNALLTAQRGWHRQLTSPLTGFTASVQWLFSNGLSDIPWAIENLLQLTVTIVFLVLTACAWRRLDGASRMYAAGFWVVVLLSPEWLDHYYAPLSSMDRFVLLLFPVYLWMAARWRMWRDPRTVAISSVLMLAVATVHLCGGWVG